MGSEDRWAYPADGEGPVNEVEVSAFSIDRYTVSNADFSSFVEATGYVTDAEEFGWSFVFAGPWVLDHATPGERAELLGEQPLLLRVIYRLVLKPRYQRLVRPLGSASEPARP